MTDVGTCARGHEWTPENTYTVPSTGKRMCRACKKMKDLNRTYPERSKSKDVRCGSCGEQRTVSARTERRIRTGELTGTCETCRWGPRVEATDELRAWWTERFTDAELHVLAAGLLDTTPEHRSDVRDRLPKWRTKFQGRAPVTSELIQKEAA
jgi:hypothetical protein